MTDLSFPIRPIRPIRGAILLLTLLVLLLDVCDSSAAPKKARPPTFSVSYEGTGQISLYSLVRQPNAGDCNITSSEKNASISRVSWATVWSRIPLARSSGRKAMSATIEGTGKNNAANIYDLSGCRGGYTVNNCVAPSACSEDAGSCQANDLYQTPGYPVMMTLTPDKRRKGRWLVTVAAEGAAFSACAAGVLNNSFFEESPTTAQFYLTAAKTKRTSVISPVLAANNLDCSESVPGLDYTCRIGFEFITSITVTGNVAATPIRRKN